VVRENFGFTKVDGVTKPVKPAPSTAKKGEMAMRVRVLGAALAAVPAALLLAGVARADEINVNVGTPYQQPSSVVVQPSQPPVVVQPALAPPAPTMQPGPTVVVPPGSSTVIVPGVPQTVQAEDIEANEVRAQTIYANKIKASEVRGVVHQTGQVKIGNGGGDIKAPTVTASVIYADEIKANFVVADNIYVRRLERR
jgi:hypothetical protein